MRRLFSLAIVLGLLVLGLSSSTVTANSCEECEEECSMIPMETGECLQLYCPECAGASSPVGVASPKAG